MRHFVLLLLIAGSLSGELVIGFNSTPKPSVGYKIGNFIPYLSLGLINTSGEFTQYSYRYNQYLPDSLEESFDTLSWGAVLLNTSLGTRVFLAEREIRPFIDASVGIPLPLMLKISSSDTTAQNDFDLMKEKMYEDPQPQVNIQTGLGLEAFVGGRWSISGQLTYSYTFGSLLASYSYKYDYDDEGNLYYEEEDIARLRFSLGRTGANIGLNFYF